VTNKVSDRSWDMIQKMGPVIAGGQIIYLMVHDPRSISVRLSVHVSNISQNRKLYYEFEFETNFKWPKRLVLIIILKDLYKKQKS